MESRRPKISERLARVRLFRKAVLNAGKQRTEDVLGDISEYLNPGERCLDIGAGSCQVALRVSQLGLDVVPVDVLDVSCVDGLSPVVYSGDKLPFEDDSFDVALIITVLHHVQDVENLVRDASRVARRIVIQEDIYTTTTQKWMTYVMDSVLNFEFFGHPHNNKTDAGWRELFEKLGLKVDAAKYKTFWRFFSSVTYSLSRASADDSGDGVEEKTDGEQQASDSNI